MVLRRFLVLVYRDTPGERLLVLLRHSVHSRVIMMRTPFLLAMVFALGVLYTFTYIDTQLTIFAYCAEFDQIFF